MPKITTQKQDDNTPFAVRISRWRWTTAVNGVQIKLVRFVDKGEIRPMMRIKLRHKDKKRHVVRRTVYARWGPIVTSKFSIEAKLFDKKHVSVRTPEPPPRRFGS